jgi:methylmalonyl-CoA mutase cobalamin-binding domain/chain
MMDFDERLVNAMGDLDDQEVVVCVESMLSAGTEPLHIVELCRKGFEVVGKRYENREYFLSGLIISDDIFRNVMSILDASGCFRASEEGSLGRVVLGAPLGDVHDIGKGIVAQLLRYSGFEVIDLGVNIKPAGFLEATIKNDAAVVGISTLITMAYESLRETVLDFEREGLRDKVKIMLGGGAVSQRVCEYAGADAWSRDAADAVKFAKKFIERE